MEKIVIGGRTFTIGEETTISRDYWLMSRIRRAGLDHIETQEGETPEALVQRILAQTIDADVTFDLLAGLLIPDGVEWSKEVAADTAEFLAKQTAKEDKAKINGQTVGLIISFLEQGVTSFNNTRPSSQTTLADGHPGAIN